MTRAKLTFAGKALAAAFAYLVGAAAVLANPTLLVAAAVPLLVLAGASAPARVRVERTLDRELAKTGDRVECELRVTVPAGLRVVEVHQPLPVAFALLAGSNFRALRGSWRSRTHSVRFAFEASKRGDHEIAPPTVRVADPLGVVEREPEAIGESARLQVLPRTLRLDALRDVRAQAKRPLPEMDFARLGIPTTEFREIREYVQGDPLKNVNWKATARRLAAGGHTLPLVNEHEFEGKKSVWILVDGGRGLEIGDTVRDARESAIEAALGLAEAFLRRGFAVGASTWRATDTKPLMPAADQSQIPRLRSRLARLAPAEGPTLPEAIQAIRPIALARRPLFLVFTRLDSADTGTLDGLVALRGIHGERLRGTPALIVDLQPWTAYASLPDAPGREAVVAERRERALRAQRRARGTGAIVMEWDPGARQFALELARKGIA